jgi:hypothetical protein
LIECKENNMVMVYYLLEVYERVVWPVTLGSLILKRAATDDAMEQVVTVCLNERD